MATTSWNDAEEDALQYLPHLAQLLYLRCLRRFMDYSTGLVGQSRRISYQMFMERLEVPRPTTSPLGNETEKPSRKALRLALHKLEAAGLVEQVNKQRFEFMIFKLPLASSDLSGLAEAGHEKGNGSGTWKNHTYIYKSENEVTHRSGAKEGHGKQGIPPVSGKDKTLSPTEKTVSPSYPQEVEETASLPAIPTSPGQWAVFFAQPPQSFSFATVHAVSCYTMYAGWCEKKVSVADVRLAVQAANGKLGTAPATPAYYRNFVEQVIHERLHQAAGGGSHGTHQLSRQSGARAIAHWYDEPETGEQGDGS